MKKSTRKKELEQIDKKRQSQETTHAEKPPKYEAVAHTRENKQATDPSDADTTWLELQLIRLLGDGYDFAHSTVESLMNDLQQQVDTFQNQSSDGMRTPHRGGRTPQVDIEVMKLKRLIDQRARMFDMLRQIIDHYNTTAKNTIDSIGR